MAEEAKIDFIGELHLKNCQHIIDNILQNLTPITVLRTSKVCQRWKEVIKDSPRYPHKIAQLFHKYLDLNPFEPEDLLGGQHLTHYKLSSHKMYPGGDVKTILVNKNLLFVGLASGIFHRIA